MVPITQSTITNSIRHYTNIRNRILHIQIFYDAENRYYAVSRYSGRLTTQPGRRQADRDIQVPAELSAVQINNLGAQGLKINNGNG